MQEGDEGILWLGSAEKELIHVQVYSGGIFCPNLGMRQDNLGKKQG